MSTVEIISSPFFVPVASGAAIVVLDKYVLKTPTSNAELFSKENLIKMGTQAGLSYASTMIAFGDMGNKYIPVSFSKGMAASAMTGAAYAAISKFAMGMKDTFMMDMLKSAGIDYAAKIIDQALMAK